MARRKALNFHMMTCVIIIILLPLSQLVAFGSNAQKKGTQRFFSETINYRSFYWAKVVLDQYNVSGEALDIRMKEMDEYWKAHLEKFLHGVSTSFQYNYNYSDPLTQATYIRYDLALLSYTHIRIIDQNPVLAALFDDKPLLNIVSIGSGPGSDMAGVLGYLMYHRYRHYNVGYGVTEVNSRSTCPMLRFLITDRVSDWSRAINLLENAIREDESDGRVGENINMKNIVRFEKLFYQWDLVGQYSNSKSGEQVALDQLPSVITGDLFMFSRVLTDIMLDDGNSGLLKAAVNIRRLFLSAPDGALFFFAHDAGAQEKLKPIFDQVLFPPGDPSHIKVSDYVVEEQVAWRNQTKAYLGKYLSNHPEIITVRLHVLLVRKVGPEVEAVSSQSFVY